MQGRTLSLLVNLSPGSPNLQGHMECSSAAASAAGVTVIVIPDACSPKGLGRRELMTYKGKQSPGLPNGHDTMRYDLSTWDKREGDFHDMLSRSGTLKSLVLPPLVLLSACPSSLQATGPGEP